MTAQAPKPNKRFWGARPRVGNPHRCPDCHSTVSYTQTLDATTRKLYGPSMRFVWHSPGCPTWLATVAEEGGDPSDLILYDDEPGQTWQLAEGMSWKVP